jgi:thioredoxin reductase (NADPH)
VPLHNCELVIIGGGVAGSTAALYGRRFGLDLLVLERGVPGGQTASASCIENYPGFPEGITGPELAQAVTEQALKVGVEYVNAEVMGLSHREDGRWIAHTDQGDCETVSLIVAVGASPRHLKVPGERELAGRGVSYCATCDGFFFRGQTVAVVGGGNTAVDEAIYLSEICAKVYVVHRRDQLRCEKFLQDRLAARPNIEVVWDSVVVEIRGEDAVGTMRVRNVKSGEDRVLELQGVFIAIGNVARTDWLGDFVEREDGFILTNENMETNAAGIFAAGDVRKTLVRQITTAVGNATTAAFFAYHYVQDFRARAAEASG